MDLNLVVLAGRLAAPPEVRVFESGTRLARYLVTVRTEDPVRRVDVVPVSLWDPEDALIDADPQPGQRVWVAGAVQRRFWSGEDGRRSRIEVVAEQVCLREGDDSDHAPFEPADQATIAEALMELLTEVRNKEGK